MELNKLIEERRSIRKYLQIKVEKELIDQMINAAIQAPSWKNSQTARYHIIMSDQVLDNVKTECLPEFNANNCKDAPVLIVCTFIKDRAGFNKDGSPTNEVGQGWGYYDCGLHNENLILKAKDLGLDTLIMGIRDESKLREILNIKDEEIVVSVISVGYRDINPEKPKRKEIEEIVVYYE